MITKKGDFKFPQKQRKANQMKSTLHRWIGIYAKNWFFKGFRQSGGQTDDSSGGWEVRKKEPKGRRRNILTGRKSHLKNSIGIIKSTFHTIIVGSTGIIYARIHNEGLTGKAWGKHSFKMPKREFIGKSTKLESDIKKRIKKEMNLIFR